MNSRRPFALAASLALSASLAALLLAGCRITSNNNGKGDNVNIGTPFGSMSVKTDGNANTAAIGLTPYPGATPLKDDSDNDAADVNMNFGSFHLGVEAKSYQTADSQSKVLAFYRKDLARYGDVIECNNNSPVGQPTRTSQGLTCENTRDNHHVQLGSDLDDSSLELRAGSEQHQHIVSVEAKNGGTKIGLVLLELPSDHNDHNGKQQSE